jgi:RNA polymerase sigma-70 factor (ECF subfamily)
MSTDEELWRRAIEGHSLAFGEIFDRHHLRVQMLARLPEGTHETDPADDIADRLASAQSIAAVRSAFHGLRRQDQEILTLCVLEGFSMADAALALDIPAGTVKSRLSRAKAKLAEQMTSLPHNADFATNTP